MSYRSHTEEAIAAALRRREEVWVLSTASRDEDDHLIGTYSQVLADVLYHYEMDELPADWSLDLADVLDELPADWSLDIVRPSKIAPKIHYAHGNPWATVASPASEKEVIVCLTNLLYDQEGRLYLLAFEGDVERRLYLD